jgi:hypothetical protein
MGRALLFTLLVTSASLNTFGQAATSAKYPRVVTELSVTKQSETIPMTTFYTPKTNGIYRVSAYMALTPAVQGCNAFWALTVSWTDESGVDTATSVHPEGTIVVRGIAGRPLKYGVFNLGLSCGQEYDVFLVVEQLTNK